LPRAQTQLEKRVTVRRIPFKTKTPDANTIQPMLKP